MNEHGFCSCKKPLLDNIAKKGLGVSAMMGLVGSSSLGGGLIFLRIQKKLGKLLI
jgi:hypothetical protein